MAMEFGDFLRSIGLRPGVIAADGKIRRCPTDSKPRKKNGAYFLAPDGLYGWGQDHRVHAEPIEWRPERRDVALPAFDPAKLRRAREDHRRKQEYAVQDARRFYAHCTPLRGGHPYLRSHGLDMTGCYGLRVDRDGWLVVPIFIGRNITSLQRIAPDGTKLFWKDAPFKGGSYTLRRPGAPLTILCEGLATGLALYAAVPTASVTVAFTAGNMVQVAPRIGPGLRVVAADNDHETVCHKHRAEGLEAPFEPWDERPDWCLCNPGRAYGDAAAEILGCGVALPTGIHGTDWCDWMQEHLAERMEKRGPYQSAATVRAAVNAQMRMEIQKHARMGMSVQKGSQPDARSA